MSSPLPPSSTTSHNQDDHAATITTTTFPPLGPTSDARPTHDQPRIPTTSSPADIFPFQFDDFYQDELALMLLLDDDDGGGTNTAWPWQSTLPIQHDDRGQVLLHDAHHDAATILLPSGGRPALDQQMHHAFQQSGEAGSSSTTATKQNYEERVLQIGDGGPIMTVAEQGTRLAHEDDNIQRPGGGGGEEWPGPTSIKKLDHNAKERFRRLKLNSTYLALRSLLPDSQKPKKKWSGPYMVDRAIEYIPELEAQIKNLTTKKNEMLSAVLMQQERDEEVLNLQAQSGGDNQVFTVSINEVKRGEVIIQICQPRDAYSKIIDKVEDEGMTVLSASTLIICDDRSSYHLHVEMCETSDGNNTDYIQVLKDKVVSWLQS